MMKKAIYSAILLLVLSFSTATAQTTFKSGIEYNDFIVAEQSKIGVLIGKFNGFIELSSYNEARTLLTGDMVSETRLAIRNIKRMPAYNGDSKLRDAAIGLFNFYLGCFENEYLKMLNILAKSDISPADADEMNKILKIVTDNEKVVDDAFQSAQADFAAKNGFTLTK